MTTDLITLGDKRVREWAHEARFTSINIFDRDVTILDCEAHRAMIHETLEDIYEGVLKATTTTTENLSHPATFNEKLTVSLKTGKKKTTLRIKLSVKNADSVYFMDLSTVIKLPNNEFYDELHKYMTDRDLT